VLADDPGAPISARLDGLHLRIAAAAQGRPVTLLAVVKRQPAASVLAAYRLGLRDFGHSFVQEALDTADQLRPLMPDARWHFIGAVQSNKTRHLVAGWSLVHAVERLKTARRLASPSATPTSVLVQVNVGGESTKGGVAPEDAGALVTAVAALDGVRVRGLMTMPPTHPGPWFERLATLRHELLASGALPADATQLSMGTSGDFEAAIAAGSTLVRLGTALFGPRR
jgi:pyridoxal phosphate enzyme (YggS family)